MDHEDILHPGSTLFGVEPLDRSVRRRQEEWLERANDIGGKSSLFR